MLAVAVDVAEAVGPDARPRVHDHPLPERGAGIERHSGKELAPRAHPHAAADDAERADANPVA